MSKFPPTEEQQAILRAAREESASLMITAYAGCGKTTTLEMLAQALPEVPSIALAFNVKIKKELEKRFPKHFEVLTLNGLGHRAWGRALGRRLEVDERKLGKLITEELRERRNGIAEAEEAWSTLKTLVTQAMQQGLALQGPGLPKACWSGVPDTPETWVELCRAELLDPRQHEEYIAAARSVLGKSIKLGYAGVISFDDQIYLPVCFGGAFPHAQQLLVDEGQDLSPLNHEQVRRVAGLDGRLFVVGDPKQAIYAFRGADSASMTKLRSLRRGWIDLPLATTFRCPKVVVARQQKHAPGFTAWKTNIEGAFKQLGLLAPQPEATAEAPQTTWNFTTLRQLGDTSSIAILCRNNAPLLSMAFKLLRQGIGVVFLGRDIGKSLVGLAKKLAPKDDTSSAEVARAIEEWQVKETSLAEANGNEHLVSGIIDRAECLRAVLGSDVETAGELRSTLECLFARESGLVTLSTGHRAKGLEWPVVVHLDPWRIPSKYAQRNPAQLEQELNLKYVIETRSQRLLLEASLNDFEEA